MQNQALAAEYEAQYLVEPGSSTKRAVSACTPFVICVTGHRNLAEGDLARARHGVAPFLTPFASCFRTRN